MKTRKWLGLGLAGVGLVLVILWVAGVFSGDSIEPGQEAFERSARRADLAQAVEAQARIVTAADVYEAVGTVIPRTETMVEAQVTAKVLDIPVRAGDTVSKGDVLVVLDSRELETQLEQARQGLQSAESARDQAKQAVNSASAAFNQARAQYQRMSKLYADKAITSQEMDVAQAGYLQAEAELMRSRDGEAGAEAAVRQAMKAVEQAEIGLGYTEILAHEDGEIARRQAEPGDIAFPGKGLLVLQAGGAMQLQAMAPEGLMSGIRPGAKMDVAITALDAVVPGVVEEVEPAADPRTRTFLVKVGLPALAGAYPGMFGRLLVPTGERDVVVVPPGAVHRLGQLETVDVKQDGEWVSLYVKTGRELKEGIEILSGLDGAEIVAVPGGEAREPESGNDSGNDSGGEG